LVEGKEWNQKRLHHHNFWIGSDKSCVDDFWVGNDSISSTIYVSAVNQIRWRFQRQLGNCVALRIFESIATRFSSTISESAVAHVGWWFSPRLVIFAPYVFPRESVSLLNCGVSSESIFAAELWSQQRINSTCCIMVSATNQFSLSNCGVSNKSIFVAEFVESATNQFLLLNCGVSSEPIFATELCVSNEPVFVIEFGVTDEPVSPTILYSSKSVRWQICVTSEPVLLTKFYNILHIRTGSMIKMIVLYDCNI